MKTLKTSAAAVIAAIAFTPLAIAHGSYLSTAQQAKQTPVMTTDLGDGLYMLQGRGGNIGVLVGDDGVFVVDSQYADMAPAILSAINNIAGNKPRYLLNTHWHGDHVGGNQIIGQSGATIIAHQGVRDRVTVDVTRDFFGEQHTTPALPPEAWPVITFNDQMTLYLNGQTIRLVHAPNSHTDGDTFVVFEQANVIHTGDLMFNRRFPFVDITSGGSFDGYIKASVQLAMITDETVRIIPGHGPLATRADLKSSLAMLGGTTEAVEAEMDQGKTIDEVLAAAPLAPWAEDWAWGFINAENFTRMIYADLERTKAAEQAVD